MDIKNRYWAQTPKKKKTRLVILVKLLRRYFSPFTENLILPYTKGTYLVCCLYFKTLKSLLKEQILFTYFCITFA